KGKVVALYHSHTNHDKSHFSGSDVTHALKDGKPIYDIPFIVVASKDGKVHDRKAYQHNAQTNSFVESQVKPTPKSKLLYLKQLLAKVA
ncbi:hypothetical protein HY024_03865, partial [Candidatus Curtissbacteria bacterium]|nr:hypothetical protein [Candidatus Curtissbacteria bacterium]